MQDKGGNEEMFKVIGSAYETLDAIYAEDVRGGGVPTYYASHPIDLETALSIFSRVMAEFSVDESNDSDDSDYSRGGSRPFK